MPRTDLSPAEKVKLLDRMREHPAHTSVRTLAELLNVPRATVGRLRRLEAEIRLQAQSESSQKRRRDGKNPQVEQALFQWFQVVSGRGLNVSGPVLLKTAQELALKLGYADFKATDGWLSRWKKRHNVKLKKFQGEKSAIEDWRTTVVPDILSKFPPANIYSADETALFYRAVPDASLCFRRDAADLATVTILCCANMTGHDKRKLVMIKNSDGSNSFQGLSQSKLPMVLVANDTAKMTSSIFAEWLVQWDNELQSESRCVALLVADCPSHPNIDYLQNITLVFLPPFLAPPMALGITKNIKDRYKSKLVEFVKTASLDRTAKDIGGSINLDRAVSFFDESWRDVAPHAIQRCFSQCGFTIDQTLTEAPAPAPAPTSTDDEAVLSVLSVVGNCQEFRNLDNDLKCYDEAAESADERESRVGESVGREASQPDETMADPLECEIKQENREECGGRQEEQTFESVRYRGGERSVPLAEAEACIETLRRFFTQKGNESSPMSALETCHAYVAKLASGRATHPL